jgi:hypothetical protein
MSKAGVFSPSSQPIFDGQLVRNPTRIQLQQGGQGEFPFQWSWPGLVNYAPAVSPVIPNIAEITINTIGWTLVNYPTTDIDIEFYVNGGLVHTITGIASNGWESLAPGIVIPALAVTGIIIDNVGSADGSGLWIGMSSTTL